MSNNQNNRYFTFSLIGIFFLVLGLVLLFSKFHLLSFEWSYVFWCSLGFYGLSATLIAFSQQRRLSVFFGSFIFFLSIGMLLHKFGYIDTVAWNFFATVSLAISFSCIMTFLVNIRYYGVLIPALIFGTYGLLYYLYEYEIIELYDVFSIVRTYWPVVLILWGLLLIIKRK